MKKLFLLALAFGCLPALALPPYAYELMSLESTSPNQPAIYIYSWQTRLQVGAFNLPAAADKLAINPNGKFLYALDRSNGSFLIISTATNSVVRTLNVGTGGQAPTALTVTPDGKQIWVARRDGSVVVVCAINDVILGKFQLAPGLAGLANVVFSPDGKLAYIAGTQNQTVGYLKTVNTSTKQVVGSVQVGDMPEKVAITPDGRYVYVGSLDGIDITPPSDVTKIDTQTDKVTAVLPNYNNVVALVVSPDGKQLYVSLEDEYAVLEVVDVATDNVIWSTTTPLDDPNSAPTDIAIQPDGKYAWMDPGSDINIVDTTTFADVQHFGPYSALSTVFIPTNPVP